MPKIFYSCEFCGNVFETELESINCEKNHLKPEEVTCCQYYRGDKYPYSLTVKFKDGEIRVYETRIADNRRHFL